MLIVEDDRSARDYYAAVLSLAGFDVRTSADGATALQEIDQRVPDVLVLDLDLPLLSGSVVHEALQSEERTRRIPTVVVTGADAAPFAPFSTITKPVEPERLVQAVFDAWEHAFPQKASGRRTVVWVCPVCRRVVRESREAGHPMTSEVRVSEETCTNCRAGHGEQGAHDATV